MTGATQAGGAGRAQNRTRAVEALRRDYRAAFLRYLPRREEVALDSGYRMGRDAVAEGLSMLELALVHHDILVEVLRASSAEEHPEIAAAASEFFLEALASYDMTQRVHRAGASERPGPQGRTGGGV
jgi:hypothetical protein